MLQFSFKMCTDIMFKNKLCMGWDETTKRQKSFECLKVMGGTKTQSNLESLVAGYIHMPSKSANDSIYCIKHSIERINENINFWKKYKNEIANENFDVNFNKFETKITALNSDRAATNYAIQRKLNENSEIEINVSNNNLFNCLSHDLNSLISFFFCTNFSFKCNVQCGITTTCVLYRLQLTKKTYTHAHI